ncbi:hypothetical protein SEVIR_5G282001v4 [Setaria viridis]
MCPPPAAAPAKPSAFLLSRAPLPQPVPVQPSALPSQRASAAGPGPRSDRPHIRFQLANTTSLILARSPPSPPAARARPRQRTGARRCSQPAQFSADGETRERDKEAACARAGPASPRNASELSVGILRDSLLFPPRRQYVGKMLSWLFMSYNSCKERRGPSPELKIPCDAA